MHALPLPGLESKNIVANIMSFHGRQKEGIKLSLVLSKKSRAFIICNKGLQGSLVERHNNIMSWVYEVQTSSTFREETLGFLEESELATLPAALASRKKPEEKESLLRLTYPAAFPALLKAMGRIEELQKLYVGYENYTWYILGEIVPEVHKLRRDGRLQIGKKTFVEDNYEFEYEGELLNGLAHGRGKYKRWGETVDGMFFKDKLHGFCTRSDKYFSKIYEYRQGVPNGKSTSYKAEDEQVDGKHSEIENYMYENGVERWFNTITYVSDHAFFTKDGKPFQAVAKNWRDFRGTEYDKY